MKDYIEAILFTERGRDEEGNEEENDGFFLDERCSASDFSEEANETIRQDLEKFRALAEELGIDLDIDGNDSGKLELDFWLTRNGHGAGFWDGDWEVSGEALTKLAHEFPEQMAYMGSDKKIHLE